MKIIAHIRTDFPDKFGIPRQSGIVKNLKGKIIFEPEYRNPDAIRGLDGFSHIWILWKFSKLNGENGKWSPTVRPPRLGGNKKVGVFASRSPYRPNPIGMSCVKIEKIENTKDFGPVIYVSGVDMADNTPIYDIKPYLNYVDCIPEATNGFADEGINHKLEVDFPDEQKNKVPTEHLEVLIDILKSDPRPSYIEDADRVYGMYYANLEIKFKVSDVVLEVCDVTAISME